MTDFPSYRHDGGNKILFEYLKPLPFSLAEDIVSRWIVETCHAESKEVLSITIVFCSDDYLQGINSKYLLHEDHTDVISFPYQTDPIEGDLFVSVDRVVENATAYSSGDIEHELCRVVIHGILHLCGHTDQEDAGRRMMTKREDQYLQKLSLLS